MDEEFEKDLYYLLQKHFGEKWEFNWEGQEDGFDLKLWVWGKSIMKGNNNEKD